MTTTDKTMTRQYSLATAPAFVGRDLGVSDWVTVDQDRIDQFAACTGDRQWIHVDVDRARRESPFGGPIAHGYLTLSLVAAMVMELGAIALARRRDRPQLWLGQSTLHRSGQSRGARSHAGESNFSRAATWPANAAQAAMHVGDRRRGQARFGRRSVVHVAWQARRGVMTRSRWRGRRRIDGNSRHTAGRRQVR